MHSFVTSKNVKWCHIIWPTLYSATKCINSHREKNCRGNDLWKRWVLSLEWKVRGSNRWWEWRWGHDV